MTPILSQVGGTHHPKTRNFKSCTEGAGTSSPRSRTTTRLTSYTEKSLLVLKNFVFMEKNGIKEHGGVFGGQGDAFTNGSTEGDLSLQFKRVDNSATSVSKRKSKVKSWMPNGGGIKPYNSPEAQKVIVPAEECIVDVKAVKPKVDTWFKRKSKETPRENQIQVTRNNNKSLPKKVYQLNDGRNFYSNPVLTGDEGDKTVKNLTSFWNDHLRNHPLTVSTTKILHDVDCVWKTDRSCQVKNGETHPRPKSVGSDGVVQEHTLLPSKILSDLKKLTSFENVMEFAKRANFRKCNDNSPGSPSNVLELPPDTQVLTLSFKPFVDVLKRSYKGRYISPKMSGGSLRHDSAPQRRNAESSSSYVTSGVGSTEILTVGDKRCSLERLGLQGDQETIQAMTDKSENQVTRGTLDVFSMVRNDYQDGAGVGLRLPFVTEPLSSTRFTSIDGTPAGHHCNKRATVEVLPRGVRVALFLEYQWLGSFLLVQSTLVLVVLLIRWLQEYTV